MNRRETLYSRFPPAPAAGYELDPDHGYFSVILPEATTNLVTNPSVEVDMTGYANHGGATVAQVLTWQAYGAAGISVTPAAGAENGLYFGTVSLTAGTTYTFSVTIQGEEGRKYFIWFATTAGALIGSKRTWIGTGRKQRIWVTYTETSSTTRRVYVTRDAYADQHIWYADGLQVEAKVYPTTYCDGDQKGFVINQAAYLWTGTPHASTSTRSAQTRAGGREVSLLSLGFRILSIIGLGMAPLVDQSLAIPGQGELYQGTGTTAREFSLVGSIFGDGPGPRHLQDIRDGLIDAFKPDLVSVQQPMLLRYQALDENGDPCSDTLDLVCTYQGALEGNWNNHQREDLALNFKMHLPLIANQYMDGALLGFSVNVANANYILQRNSTGTWSAMGTGMTGGNVASIVAGPDGNIYAGGGFTQAGGVANTSGIARWNGSAWNAVGTGVTAGGGVNAIAIGPDGTLYAAGVFTQMGGVANTSRIAKWDGSVWTPLGTGMNNTVYTLTIGPDGQLYAGGLFTLAGGVANTVYIARWNGAAWNALSTGMDGYVTALVFSTDGYLYAGGLFTLAGGVTVANMARWNGTAWSVLATGMNAEVDALIYGPDAQLYAGGQFSQAGGVANTNAIARWNGTKWSSLGTGVSGGYVFGLYMSSDNILYVAGSFTGAGPLTVPKGMALWNGSAWLYPEIILPGSPSVNAILAKGPTIYVGFSTNGSATANVVTAINNTGSAKAYPKFVLTGPGGLIQIKNYTTGKAIYILGTIAAGEKITLDLSPDNLTCISSFRGNVLSLLLPGSNMDFELLPGTNDISVFIGTGTTVATSVLMSWKNNYWSLDGAVVK